MDTVEAFAPLAGVAPIAARGGRLRRLPITRMDEVVAIVAQDGGAARPCASNQSLTGREALLKILVEPRNALVKQYQRLFALDRRGAGLRAPGA
jgi:hypothetical protein